MRKRYDNVGETTRVRSGWDCASESWDEFVETGLDYARLEVHGPALLRECGRVDGRRVLDVGCGQGYFSRILALKGAKVVGLDLSPKMIGHAQEHEKKRPLGVEYRVMDATQIGRVWAPGSFDLVTACMSLHDMPGPGKVIRSASKVLTEDGVMAFSVVHPVNSGSAVWEEDAKGGKTVRTSDYFRSGKYIVSWNMARLKHHWRTESYSYTLSDWSKMAEGSGFLIERIREPRPTPNQVKRHPELEVCSRIPFFLVLRLTKNQGSAEPSATP